MKVLHILEAAEYLWIIVSLYVAAATYIGPFWKNETVEETIDRVSKSKNILTKEVINLAVSILVTVLTHLIF